MPALIEEQPAAGDAPSAPGRPRRERRATATFGLVLLGFAIAYVALSLAQPIPTIFRDEFQYQHLARSLADGAGMTWRGEDVSLRAALYVYLIAPVWLMASGVRAYHLAKVESALICCLVAVPVWVLARELLERRLALLPPVLALSGTWMLAAAGLLTENLALPLAAAALALTVLALRRPGGALPWVALALAVLAAWARLQLVVLVPAMLATYLIDAGRAGPLWRARLREHRAVLLALTGLVVVGAGVVAVAGSTAVGGYSGVLREHVVAGDLLRKSGLQLAQLAAMCGFLPLVLAAAVAVRPRAWRDPVAGPLLAVFWPTTLLLALQSGYFLADYQGATWGIERYMAYAAPLAVVLVVVLFARRLVAPVTLALAAALSLLLLLTPGLGDASEERAVAATTDLLGGVATGTGLAVAALVTCAGAAAALAAAGRRRGPAATAAAVGTGLLIVLVAQSAVAWNWQLDLTRTWRTQFPSDLEWVDHHSHGPVAVLEVTSNATGFEQYDFFNERITRYYAAPGPLMGRPLQGRMCRWRIAADGRLLLQRDCGAPPREFFINDPAGHLTFHDETASTSDPHAGRLVAVAGPPRLRSLVVTPCDRKVVRFRKPRATRAPAAAPVNCQPSLLAELWLDRPGTLLIRLRGGADEHVAQSGTRRFAVPAARVTTLRLAVPTGRSVTDLQLDWQSRSPEMPDLLGVELEQAGRRGSLL